MKRDELKLRTKQFALRVIRMSESNPQATAGHVSSRKLIRCATSVGANDRAPCRGRSESACVSKLQTVVEESGERCYRLELFIEAHPLPPKRLDALLDEAHQSTAIMVASRKMIMRRKDQP